MSVRHVTGSASTGHSKKYYYYHCQSPCGYRYKVEIINNKFLEVLQALEMREPIKKYLRKVLKQNFEKFINNPQHERKKILLEIDGLNNRLKSARNKLLQDVIDDDEYLEIKTDCKDQIEKLESKLTKVKDKRKIDFPKLLDQALSNIINLVKVYSDEDIDLKRKIVSSIFPEKLEFLKIINYSSQRFTILYLSDKQ